MEKSFCVVIYNALEEKFYFDVLKTENERGEAEFEEELSDLYSDNNNIVLVADLKETINSMNKFIDLPMPFIKDDEVWKKGENPFKEGNKLNEEMIALEDSEQIEKGSDERGLYAVCPKCKQKCRYMSVGDEGWCCECLDCDELLDED